MVNCILQHKFSRMDIIDWHEVYRSPVYLGTSAREKSNPNSIIVGNRRQFIVKYKSVSAIW